MTTWFTYPISYTVQNNNPYYYTSGELTQVAFPYGGSLGWGYGTVSYNNNFRTQREVQSRYLTMSSGGSQLTSSLNHPNDTGTWFHSTAQLTDSGGLGQKYWHFDTTSSDTGYRLMSAFEDRDTNVAKTHTNYTWTLETR